MFAEPVNKSKVKENFQLICITHEQEIKTLNHTDIGLQNSSYQYTLRNLYYSNKTSSFTNQLFKSSCSHCYQLFLQQSKHDAEYRTIESFYNEE